MKTAVNAEIGTKQHAETIERYTQPVIEVLQTVCEAIGWHLDLQKPPDPDDETNGLFSVDKADIEIRCMFAHLGDFFGYNVGAVRKDSHFINREKSDEEASG